MKLKKITTLTATALGMLLLFTGCGNNERQNSAQTPQTQAPAVTDNGMASATNAPGST